MTTSSITPIVKGISYFLLIISLYSLIINYIFGHKTFWRNFPQYIWRKVNRLIKQISSLVLNFTSSDYGKKRKQFSIENLHESIVIHCLIYLQPLDLLQFSVASKALLKLSNHLYIWTLYQQQMIEHAQPYLPSVQRIIDELKLHSSMNTITAKKFFFLAYHKICEHLLQLSFTQIDDTASHPLGYCYVMLEGNIYNLTDFQSEHPGGIDILQNWKGKDASKPFKFAYHSFLALDIAKNYLIWSKEKIIGSNKLSKRRRLLR